MNRSSNRPINLVGLLLLAALAGGPIGCAGLNLKQPTASLHSLNVGNLTPDGVTLNFNVDVQNPNAIDIPAATADYRLGLSGVEVLNDKAAPDGKVPANGATTVLLPVHLSFEKMLAAEQAIAKSGGNVPYDLVGAIGFDTNKIPLMPKLSVPVHFSGTLPLRNALKSAMTDPRFLESPAARKIIESLIGGSLREKLRF